MPAVPAPAKVLVTGASGFIAVQLCSDLLKRGYTVVGTVRSIPKGEYLVKLHGSDRFSFVIVEDNEAPGAFDEAVKGGFHAIQHTSSPFHLNADDPQDIIGPAVKGTVAIMESVMKNAPDVKRVVVTSSVASVLSPKEPGYIFTEADWNDFSPEVVEKEGRAASQSHKYKASKTLAERAAWKFVEDHKSGIKWDLVCLNPPMVYGPTMHQVASIAQINTSINSFYQSLSNPKQNTNEAFLTEARLNYVDVRDVSEAHILAIEKEEAGGQRFIVSKGPYCVQDFYDILNASGIPSVPIGFPSSPILKSQVRSIESGAKIEKVLGLKYHDAKDTVVDTVLSLRERFPEAHGVDEKARI